MTKDEFRKNLSIANAAKIAYDNGIPFMPDYEYDILYNDLTQYALENEIDISREIINNIDTNLKGRTFIHLTPMLSIENRFDVEGAEEWLHKTSKKLGKPINYILEYKFDGMALEIIYKDGNLFKLVTRGDGITGRDVTYFKSVIANIPNIIKFKGIIAIRGEVVIPKEKFKSLKTEDYKNPRNLVAGTFAKKELKGVKERGMEFIPYELGFIMEDKHTGKYFNEHGEFMDFLKDNGFEIKYRLETELAVNNLDNLYQYTIDIRDKLPIEVDGIVLKVSEYQVREFLGEGNRYPKYMLALKLPPEVKETKLLNVTWDIGITGVYTPVAEIEPVELLGSVVSNVTLHNINYFERRDIAIGDNLMVYKSGDVIPKILSIKKVEDSKPIKKPTQCLYCNEPLVDLETKAGDKRLLCCNYQCVGRLARKINRFLNKDHMNAKGIGLKFIERFIESGIVKKISDLFELDYESLKSAGFGEKNIENILNSIAGIGRVDAALVLSGFGIDGIGRSASREIINIISRANVFPELDESVLRRGVKSPRAKIYEHHIYAIELWKVSEPDSYADFKRVVGMLGKAPKTLVKGKLSDIKIGVTGKTPISRKEINEYLAAYGGIVSSISGKTKICITGENPSISKIEKLKEGSTVMEWETFKRYVDSL